MEGVHPHVVLAAGALGPGSLFGWLSVVVGIRFGFLGRRFGRFGRFVRFWSSFWAFWSLFWLLWSFWVVVLVVFDRYFGCVGRWFGGFWRFWSSFSLLWSFLLLHRSGASLSPPSVQAPSCIA